MTTRPSNNESARLADPNEARLLSVHIETAAFFKNSLRSRAGDGPRDYLKRRGFGEVVESALWEVGYAPPRWTGLTDHLRKLGFGDSEIQESGLGLSTRRNTVVDRFRDRLTFGVRDEHGQVVAFVGRAAPEAGDVPRYLNSPRSQLYDKSAVLYGLGNQQLHLASGGIPVLVEGPLDAMAVSLASTPGRPALVGLAPCGTALTTTQVRALANVATAPALVAFDADSAGMSAAARSYAILAASSPMAARAVRLPKNADPASLLKDLGPAGLRAALAQTTPLADLVVDDVLAHYARRLDNAEARLSALREAAPTVAALPSHEIARQAARLASVLNLEHQTVARELARRANFRPQADAGRRYPQIGQRAGRLQRSAGELRAVRADGGLSR